MRLKGKVAIITGAGSGIGRAAALLFAAEGAKVVVADISPEAGEESVRQVRAKGGDAIYVQTDLTDAGQVERLVRETLARFGKLDVLYNNAGVNLHATVTDTREADWDRVMAVNVKSAYLTCHFAIPEMIRNGGGSIINTASAAAIVGLGNLCAYTASKSAVLGLSRNLAIDYARHKIRVNALCPGVTATEMTLKIIASEADPVAARKRYDQGRLLGRMADPQEIARAALFLASDESSFMTGAPLVVDGGYTAE